MFDVGLQLIMFDQHRPSSLLYLGKKMLFEAVLLIHFSLTLFPGKHARRTSSRYDM